MKDNEVKLLNFQNMLSFIFIITVLISIFLTDDEKRRLLKQYRYINNDEAKYLALFNRIIIVIIACSYLYINYKNYNYSTRTNRNVVPQLHQVEASALNLLSTVLVLYVIIETWNENLNIVDIETPII